MASAFEILNKINVNDHTERKNGLTYLSWAWAWAEVKKVYPDAVYTIYERPDGCIYWTDGRTCWVKTGVTLDGLEHIEYLPVMDFKNRSIPLDQVTSTDVNKAIQRSLTKAAARHGLGLYIYAGEDLPEGESEPEPPKAEFKGKPAPQTAKVEISATMEELKRFMDEQGFDRYNMDSYRSMAVSNDIIPGKGWKDYSMDEIKALETFIVMNRQ